MPKLSLKGIRSSFSKEQRQIRLERKLQNQLSKEQSKYEKYAAHEAESQRINKLRNEIKSYKQLRRGKGRKVRIGGHIFRI